MGVEAIGEFSVVANNYSAEYGRATGGVINHGLLEATSGTVNAIQNIDPELYHRILTEMPLGLGMSKDNVCVLRQVAHKLAATMAGELCSNGQFLDRGFACDPTRPPDTEHAYSCDASAR